MKNKKYFIDICTLFEEHYTGIANVNFNVAKYFYENLYDSSEFFHVDNVIDKKYIGQIIERKHGGDWIKNLEKSHEIYLGEIESFVNEYFTVGIFSHVKYIRNVFDYEVQIVHDITYLLTKEFHHQDTTDYHLNFALKDFNSNHLNVCNSQATMNDIITYMGVDEKNTMVSLLGMDMDDCSNPLYSELLDKYQPEDFILVLGTIEPRKNISIVLNYLEKNPDILNSYKFVFIGKDGWGESFSDKFEKLEIEHVLKSNIKHLGFISHDLKNILLKSAKFLIYPSIYEGFGLPVLEAISHKTPVLTTISSSIPEVGGDVSYYFNPFSLESFSESFDIIKNDVENDLVDENNLIKHASSYTWKLFIERILKRINEVQ